LAFFFSAISDIDQFKTLIFYTLEILIYTFKSHFQE